MRSGRTTSRSFPRCWRRRSRQRLLDWFVDDAGRDRTYRDIRRFDEPLVDLDEVADRVVELARLISPATADRYGAER